MRRLLLVGFLAACGAAPNAVNGPRELGKEPEREPGLAPRLDLHCTPVAAGDEAACLARGRDYHFGAQPVCHGTQPSPDLVEAERQAYEQATAPCVCIQGSGVVPCA